MGHEPGPPMSDFSARTLGWIGASLFAALTLLAAGRFATSVRSGRVRPLTPHKRFYLLTVAAAACEVPRYLEMGVTNRALEFQVGLLPRVWYTLHLLSMWLQVCGLTVVIGLWSSVFARQQQATAEAEQRKREREGSVSRSGDDSQADHLVSRICGFVANSRSFSWAINGVLLVLTLSVVAEIFIRQPSTDDVAKALETSVVYDPFVCAVAACLLFCASGILAYGMRMHQRIAGYPWNQGDRQRIRMLLVRLVYVMSLCCLCFLGRIVLLLMMLFSKKVEDNVIFSEFEWHLCSYWIPTIIPAVVLLYLMRGPGQRSRPGHQSQNTSVSDSKAKHTTYGVEDPRAPLKDGDSSYGATDISSDVLNRAVVV